MLSSHTTEEKKEEEDEKEPEDNCPDPKSTPGQTTSDQIQKVLDCLQPHMDDPDVQGESTELENMQHVPGIIFDHLQLLSLFWHTNQAEHAFSLQLKSRYCQQL